MATAPLEALRLGLLENDIESLRKDLAPLLPMLAYDKQGMFIGHNGNDIMVFAALKYKAYIPKKYNGWDVIFVDSDGKDIEYDLDSYLQ